MVDKETAQLDYCRRQLSHIYHLIELFYTPGQTQNALQAALVDRDNMASAIRFAADNLNNMKSSQHEDGSDDGWWALASIEGGY